MAEGIGLRSRLLTIPPIGRAPSATTMIGRSGRRIGARRSADRVDVELALRDQDHVGAAGEPRMHGDPPGVPPHHLDDQHPMVGVGGGVEPIDRLHRDVDRGVEAEGVVGRREVVVDRLWYPDDRHPCSEWRRVAAPSVSSPPIAISPSTPAAARFAAIRSGPPSWANGLVREEPRMVPPRGRIPRTSGTPSGGRSSSSGPRQPSR